MTCGARSRSRVGATLAIVVALFAASNATCDQALAGVPSDAPVARVTATTLRVTRSDGSIVEGQQLRGVVLFVRFAGQKLRVRIDGVEPDAREVSGDVRLYDFRVIGDNGSEHALCAPDPEGRQLGFPLAIESRPHGIQLSFDPTRFELVCTSGAEGKCVRFGYAPWRSAPDGRSMLGWYNACVRMLRADYCGDGQPFTRDGTTIDFFDRINVQTAAGDPLLTFEAAWGADGAVCVAHSRIPELIDLDGIARRCPRLIGRLGPTACTDAAAGALLFNRSREAK
jgi:hypothetical protein